VRGAVIDPDVWDKPLEAQVVRGSPHRIVKLPAGGLAVHMYQKRGVTMTSSTPSADGLLALVTVTG
jgi:hypothetical protein